MFILQYWLGHALQEGHNMVGFSSIGVAIALAVLAIAVLTLVALRSASKPKPRREKWEKAEIMKQLLALSDSENYLAVKTTSARLHAPAPRQAKRTAIPTSSGLQRPFPIRSKTM
jgi:hypothetical protein